jgi:hypothetical protein
MPPDESVADQARTGEPLPAYRFVSAKKFAPVAVVGAPVDV